MSKGGGQGLGKPSGSSARPLRASHQQPPLSPRLAPDVTSFGMFRSKNRLGGKAHTLGVILDWLGDTYQATICDGIEQGATHAGANLLLFVGGVLGVRQGGAPRDQVYELAGRHNLDGLIVLSGALSHEVGLDGVRSFCDQFSGLPLCSVGVGLPHTPSVTVDNEAGTVKLVTHLIEQHGSRHIAFITGPEANIDSCIRVSAYRATLAKHGLRLDAQLVVQGNFMLESGASAVRALIKQFGARLEQLDAIVAANDNMAIGALDELGRQGISVPERLAVVGFDDIEEARLTEPSLTTARQPLDRIGTEAVRRLLQGGSEPADTDLRISTDLVVRQSCGCSALGFSSRSSPAAKQRFQVALMGQRDRISAQLGRAASGRFAPAGAGWEQSLLGALVDDLIGGRPEHFPPAVERLIQRLGAARVDLDALHQVLSALREEIVPLVASDLDKHRLAEDLFHATRLSFNAAMQRGHGRAHLSLMRWARRISVICNAIEASKDMAELRARTRELLPQLGLRHYFICMYDVAGDSSQARMVASSDAPGAAAVSGRPFLGRELLPAELATADGVGLSFAVLPLLGLHAVIGHVLFEYTAQHAFTCGAVSEALSIALRNFARGTNGEPLTHGETRANLAV
jgi:sigma-B regulation protein RsbU (phosphoserine phosphatase)